MNPLRSLAAPIVLAALSIGLASTVAPAGATAITVKTTADTEAADGFCSLREAMLAANDDLAHHECPAGNGEDHIVFDLALPATLVLTDHLPVLTETVAIHGPGTDNLVLDGAGLYRAITVEFPSNGILLVVQRLTLANGRTRLGDFGGGGVFLDGGVTARFERVDFLGNRSENSGGGMMVGSGSGGESHVSLVECLFEGNVSEGPAGGGGLSTTGTGSVVDILRSTFVDNHAEVAVGGGMATGRGFVTVDASTISGNSAWTNGGGVYSSTAPQGGASLIVRDTTVTGNTAGTGLASGNGGGLYLSPGPDHPLTVSLENSLVAENFDLVSTDQPDVFCGSNLLSFGATGSSLIGANDGCAGFFPAGSPNVSGDFVGTVGAPIAPRLLALANNGGPTPTHAPRLNPLSPAIDQGSCAGVVTDQRLYGQPSSGQRVRDLPTVANATDGCDIGALEVLASSLVTDLIFADGFELGHTLLWHDAVQ